MLAFFLWINLGLNALAERGKLLIFVSDPEQRPVRGLVIGVEGLGTSSVTGDDGKAALTLSPSVQAGDPVTLVILHSPPGKDYSIVSPWGGRAVVPIVSSDAVVEVIVVQRGDRAALESGTVLASLAAKINQPRRSASDAQGNTGEQRHLAILAAARELGLQPDDVAAAVGEEDVDHRKLAIAIAASAYGIPADDVKKALESLAEHHNESLNSRSIAEPTSAHSLFHVKFGDESLPDLSVNDQVLFNDQSLTVHEIDSANNAVVFLGDPDTPNPVVNGLNWLVSLGKSAHQTALFWGETRVLLKFENPYKNSYAIVSAIDDYDRVNDPLRRGKTGFRPLGGTMVKDARDLVIALKHVGFPESHILTFFDQGATSTALSNVLQAFWKGGRLEGADRVFFYFGGHGTHVGDTGLLITYDFDPQRPTLTGLLMKDLTIRNAENITAHHLMIALDSCDSGLALDLGLGVPPTEEDIKKFHKLSAIRDNVAPAARNILVAGTGKQEALWVNGGVFTKALVAGLAGNADLNHDGLIEFDELGLYIRQEVRKQVDITGVQQEPEGVRLTKFGTGGVVFVPQK